MQSSQQQKPDTLDYSHLKLPPAPPKVLRNSGVREFEYPADMHKDMLALVKDGNYVRNYFGVILKMNRPHLVIETDLFPREALEFYTNHNLRLPVNEKVKAKYYTPERGGNQGDYRDGITEKIDNVVDSLTKFPTSKRAVITIPYSSVSSKDVDHTNTAELKCLRELHFYLDPFPLNADEYKSPGYHVEEENLTLSKLDRDLHSRLGAGHGKREVQWLLGCTGVLRAQAASIFPKNIHFIGSMMNLIAEKLSAVEDPDSPLVRPHTATLLQYHYRPNVRVGPYTQMVTTLSGDRS